MVARRGHPSPNAIVLVAACAVFAALLMCAGGGALAAGAPQPGAPETSATIAPTLTPNKLASKASLSFTIRYAGGELGVPAPVRRMVLRFPAGLSLEIPRLRSCNIARLRAHGAGGCSKQSQVGTGQALVEGLSGATITTESVALSAFLGTPKHLEPAIEILGQGITPREERIVFTGTLQPDRPPYGEQLILSIPPIPTIPLEPDASIVAFSLTIGATHRHSRGPNTVITPPRCPPAGFPFAGEFTYAGGSSGDALATARCPRGAARPAARATWRLAARRTVRPAARGAAHLAARAARTFSLNETGNLHLTSKHGFVLGEQGAASGTVSGTISVKLTIISTSRVSAEIEIRRPGGSITGFGTATYQRGTSAATFSGSMSIKAGTGSYSHAHGSGLSFNGSIARSNEAIVVHVRGRVSD
jgi:hypothetical protein